MQEMQARTHGSTEFATARNTHPTAMYPHQVKADVNAVPQNHMQVEQFHVASNAEPT
jgi:hypothetical protein